MFKLITLLLLIYLNQSTAYSIKDDHLNELAKAFEKDKISLDQLFAELSDNSESNELNQFNNFDQIESTGMMFHREPDYQMDAREMIEFRGFKFEANHVVTEDCFILEMHRIVSSFFSLYFALHHFFFKFKKKVNPFDTTPNKPPVLLQHGLIDASTGWLVNTIQGNVNDEDDRNLGFALAKRGYDVWLGNYRGNTYSKNHTTYSTRDPQFWKFTFDNHALQDLPAQIAHVQKVTNYDQIAYVGYSEGTFVKFHFNSYKFIFF